MMASIKRSYVIFSSLRVLLVFPIQEESNHMRFYATLNVLGPFQVLSLDVTFILSDDTILFLLVI